MILTAYSSSAPEQLSGPAERTVVAQNKFRDAEQALLRSSFRLGAAMTEDPRANRVTSPLSALYALSMLRVGAGTTTAAEMDAVLGLPGDHRDEALNALMASVEQFDGDPGAVDQDEPPEEPLLRITNAIFFAEDEVIGRTYLGALAEHYGSGVYPVDFHAPGTGERIDAWVSEGTGGRIEKAPLTVDGSTILSLLNVVFFAAAWEQPFDASGTFDDDFWLAGGEVISVPTMHAAPITRYARGEKWSGIDLPYGGGFFMRLILPDEGAGPSWSEDEFLTIAVVLDAAEPRSVQLALPSWDHAVDQDLLVVLKAMGLDETFGPEPDFHAIMQDAVVSGAAQSATITVAEKGTVAAAVTQISMRAAGAPMPPDVSIFFDRPFGYQIVHEDTGLPVFLGTVADPR